MTKNAKENENNIQISSGTNDLWFPLIFGIVAVIVMAIISLFMGA